MKRTPTGPREFQGANKMLPSAPTHEAGQQWYDDDCKNTAFDLGYDEVRLCVGQSDYSNIHNGSGGPLTKGTFVAAIGVDPTTERVSVVPAIADGSIGEPRYMGVLAHDIDTDAVGVAIVRGPLTGVNTVGLTLGAEIYLSDTVAGTVTNTVPTAPSYIVGLGGTTRIAVDGAYELTFKAIPRIIDISTYPFSQGNIGAGTYYTAGFYAADATDTTLGVTAQQLYGSVNSAYNAHAFIVSGATPTITGGVVGLRVNGTSKADDGPVIPSDSEVLTEDITTLSLNDYLETAKKWMGQITFETYVISGTPTGTIDFNYGLAKYEDYGNRDFTVAYFECVGLAGANDSTCNIELIYHKSTGHTYAATGFKPGNGNIVSFKGRLGVLAQLYNGEPFAFKVTNVNQLVKGSESEGVVIRITPAGTNSITYMTARLGIYAEVK